MARVSIEDCLHKLENRFALVVITADRTRRMMAGDEPMLRTRNKLSVTALREVAEGYVTTHLPEYLDEVSDPQFSIPKED